MSCFILVFKPMLLNLATNVNRCLLISGFFFFISGVKFDDYLS